MVGWGRMWRGRAWSFHARPLLRAPVPAVAKKNNSLRKDAWGEVGQASVACRPGGRGWGPPCLPMRPLLGQEGESNTYTKPPKTEPLGWRVGEGCCVGGPFKIITILF